MLNHRNIIKLLATSEHDGEHYLVLEYAGGSSLADRLLTEPRLRLSKHWQSRWNWLMH